MANKFVKDFELILINEFRLEIKKISNSER
jgi:hypothetical protein